MFFDFACWKNSFEEKETRVGLCVTGNFFYFWKNLTGKDRMLINNRLINATNRYDQCSNGQGSAANELTNATNGFLVTHNATLVFFSSKEILFSTARSVDYLELSPL